MMKGEANGMLLVDIVIPVLMPSPYLEQLRKSLTDVGTHCRVNFVLDFPSPQEGNKTIATIKPFPRERFYHGHFGSPGEARNRALQVCDAKYICFWDVDDKPEPKAFLKFVKILDESNAGIGISSWTFVNSPEKIKGSSPLSFLRYPGIWRVAFKRDLLNGMSFSSIQWGEDQLFLVEALSKSPKIIATNHITYRYNQFVESSQTSKQYFVVDLSKAMKQELMHLPQAEGIVRPLLISMLFKQLITVLKLAGAKKAWEDFCYLLSPGNRVLLRTRPRDMLLILKNKWP